MEETAKGAIFLLLMGLAPVVIRTVSDGLIVGAYVGLGFQILEDVLYAQNSAFAQFGAHQSDAVLGNFVVRAVTGIPSHALYTALFAAGLIYLIGTPAQPRRIVPGLVLVLTPVLIHGIWDSAAALGGETFGVLILLADTIFSVAAILVAIRWAGRRERTFMHDIMAPEVTAGTITQAEFDALTRSPQGAPRGGQAARAGCLAAAREARPARRARPRRGHRARRRRGHRSLTRGDRPAPRLVPRAGAGRCTGAQASLTASWCSA